MKTTLTYLLSFVFCLSSNILLSQINLVPNPSFEDTITCPSNPGQINLSLNWINPTLASPDYMCSCNNGALGVPVNNYGIQSAHSGHSYALIGCFGYYSGLTNSYREYIQTHLSNQLYAGETYCIVFFVSPPNGLYNEYAVNNIGALFSNSPISSNTYGPILMFPQFVNPISNPLTNIGVWTKISGVFIAQGGEQYITLGNFK